ncbi:hypothetical protein DFH08DRAFT_877471 [Mycena albidolilacea]|uniref:Uncharacterized protein n=1 Tax=Mycena albidolilacea TaxID=1033008 RepID=A0AAD6ZS60_9AGAR|nr:hypothetical protein DFH08DRAFT_877471 [Mycena albidolilacea]
MSIPLPVSLTQASILPGTRPPIPCADVRTTGKPCPGARSLNAAGALGLVLHYLNSTMCEISLQQIFALIPTTVSQYIAFGLNILLAVLCTMPDAKIKWPGTVDEFQSFSTSGYNPRPQLGLFWEPLNWAKGGLFDISGPYTMGCPKLCVFCMGCPMGFFGLGQTIHRRQNRKICGMSHRPILNVGPLALVAHKKRISGWIGLGRGDS